VIRIRYAELPSGLHVRTEALDGQVTIWLQQGLTAAERRAALRRVRRSSRMGVGPDLPRRPYARALSADRLRTAAGGLLGAVRTHPALLTPLIVACLAVAGYLFVASAPLRAHPMLAAAGDGLPAVPGGAADPSGLGLDPPAGGGSLSHRSADIRRLTRLQHHDRRGHGPTALAGQRGGRPGRAQPPGQVRPAAPSPPSGPLFPATEADGRVLHRDPGRRQGTPRPPAPPHPGGGLARLGG
jgi:hypothetical protein